ncbi:restriction endonuclease subunit S [Paraburkholderia sp. BR14263]|uniref:restriction endonuclease subunit S n=1 Tax=unclassified Paraburkholderia TaxID=2615204 RepID=UPI0034CE472B
MSDWRPMRLDQLGTVERGRSRHRPRNDPALYGGDFPFVQTADVKAAGLRLFEYEQTYNEAGLAQSRLWPVGTLCFTIAANIGDTTILGIPACFPDSIVGFTPYPDKADVVFVKYALDYAKIRFAAISKGATQDNLSLEKLLSQNLLVPPLEIQRRIAGILGAYDDLIEVNRRRIAVLEEMAQGLFTEWFTRLRFPGHEDVTIEDTSDGPLPVGWHQATLGSLLEHTVGGLWGEASETDTEDQRVSVIRGTDIPKLLSGNYSGVPDRFVANRELRSRVFFPGDLILEASGGSKDQPVGRVMYVTASLIEKLRPPVAPASFCRLLRPSDKLGGGAYLYGLLQAMYQDKLGGDNYLGRSLTFVLAGGEESEAA